MSVAMLIYQLCKLYFMSLWLWYILALLGMIDFWWFANFTGFVGLALLYSNIRWHTSR